MIGQGGSTFAPAEADRQSCGVGDLHAENGCAAHHVSHPDRVDDDGGRYQHNDGGWSAEHIPDRVAHSHFVDPWIVGVNVG